MGPESFGSDPGSEPGGPPPSPEPTPVDLEPVDGPAGPAPLRLLTRAEYTHAVRDWLGLDGDLAARLPAENQFLGFDNFAEVHRPTSAGVEAYLNTAEDLARRTVDERLDALLPCGSNPSCFLSLMDPWLTRAFRRPPTAEERTSLRSLFDAVQSVAGFEAGLEAWLQAVLQSPQFLYRVESDAVGGDPTRLSSASVATRLAFLLWATAPDEALLDAVADEALLTGEAVEAQARRMLDDDRARQGMENFYRQLLETKNLETLFKDPTYYPDFTPQLALDLRTSLHAFMDHVLLDEDGGLSALTRSTRVYANERMGEVYGWETEIGAFGPVSTDPTRRAGLMTQPAMLSLLAKPNGSSPIARGVYLLERVLCRVLESPPPGMAIVAPDPDPNATTRERFAIHTEDEQCSGCHQFIDPVGFAFENYDGIGRWRTEENGRPVDASGALTMADDPALVGPVQDALDLVGRLDGAREMSRCMATHWFRYGMGRLETADDTPTLEAMTDALHTTGSFKELLVTLATSSTFRTRLADGGDE
jgi:hypothetical protein